MNRAEENLQLQANAWAKLGNGAPMMPEFVLKHGEPFQGVRRPLTPGVPKECFRNSFLLALKLPDVWYCEGYVVNEKIPLPILHAWLVDWTGMVIEPTLRDDGFSYYGIKFKTDFVLDQAVEHEVYGILGGSPEQAWTLMNNEATEEWKA